jgi:hypothetical protein
LDAQGEHYLKYDEAVCMETTEKDRPSLHLNNTRGRRSVRGEAVSVEVVHDEVEVVHDDAVRDEVVHDEVEVVHDDAVRDEAVQDEAVRGEAVRGATAASDAGNNGYLYILNLQQVSY